MGHSSQKTERESEWSVDARNRTELDTDARPEPADIIGNYESEWLVDFCLECGEVYVPGLPTRKVIDPTVILSDHSSFWYGGYSALFGIEDAPPVTPYVHTEGDTLGTLAQWFLTKFAKPAVATVAELAVPDTTTGIAAVVPPKSGISAYPNPFDSTTTVSFASGQLRAGRHDLVWDGKGDSGTVVSPGIYLARVNAAGNEATARVILLN